MMYDLQTMAPTLTKSSIFEMLRKEDQAEDDVRKCCFEEIEECFYVTEEPSLGVAFLEISEEVGPSTEVT
jgi:hypothetical protein